MYHNRTQAAVNVRLLVSLGKKVFLKKESTLFKLFKNKGIIVFDADLISKFNFNQFSNPLSPLQAKSNLKKITEIFSEEKRLRYLSSILN